MNRLLIALCGLALAACGGGGGGGSVAPTPSGFDFAQGVASSRANADKAFSDQQTFDDSGYLPSYMFPGPNDLVATVNISLPGGGTVAYTPVKLFSGLPIATRDTQADKAWDAGWTGKGVKLALVDDYSGEALPHGFATRGIVVQIAPEADIASQSAAHVNLSFSGQSSWGEVVQLLDARVKPFYDSLESSGHHIINNSFGVDPYRGGGTISTANFAAAVTRQLEQAGFRKIMLPAANAASYHANMLFVFSAGNSGAHCTSGGVGGKNGALDQCRIHAKALLDLRASTAEAGDRIIYVGALADGADTLASYSFSAGRLENDYIVAHDDIWGAGDSGGTSFSAPRVSAAAALVRHKFPNLDGVALKQVLLQTAEDLGDAGVDEVFGHGKLDVMNALSPIGKLRARR